MATEAARLEAKDSTEATNKTVLTHTGLLMEGVSLGGLIPDMNFFAGGLAQGAEVCVDRVGMAHHES